MGLEDIRWLKLQLVNSPHHFEMIERESFMASEDLLSQFGFIL